MASVADLFKRAVTAFQQGQFAEAERAFRQVLRKEPRNLVALNVLAIVLVNQARFAEAEPYLLAALRINATSDATVSNYGLVLKALGRPDEALAAFTQALALNPGNAETWNNRGAVRNDLADSGAALTDFDRAIALDPAYAAAWFNKSKSLAALKRFDEALVANDHALALKPDLAEAWFGRGFIFQQLRRPEDAVVAYSRARQLDPSLPLLKGNLLHQKMLLCDWSGVNELIAEIDADLSAGRLAAEPFAWQGVATSERSLQRCATLYNAARYPAQAKPSVSAVKRSGKIRIGYLSGEFRQQATSLLLVGVLEHHDKSKFEISAFDNGRDDGSDTRRRVEAAVDRMIGIGDLSDPLAVAAIRDREIDILVNLNGYFGEDRTRVFARRAAPVQINYLGFPGTLGAPYMDYIIADTHVLPNEHAPFYTETVAWLPNCYQANDRDKPIAVHPPDRAALGLPQDGFVFCCFNNSYKITPGTFDIWMSILRQVEGSVLWLLEDHAGATANLQREAILRGVAADRIVFAGRLPPAEHLARHRCADLFLDTLPYNAHTTASDALWAGLPLLTCRGDTFAGRVASSLLINIGLPDLVTDTPEAFERLAVELATDPDRLKTIAKTLATNRLTTPLFDTKAFTRHLEAAYIAMAERAAAGLAPRPIQIPL